MPLDLFDAALAERPDALALDDVPLRELHAGAWRVADRLAQAGVAPGDRVAAYCENRHAMVYAYLAALRLGAIFTPVNVLYRANDLSHALDDARPAVTICSRGSAALVRACAARTRRLDAEEIEAWATCDAVESSAEGRHRRPAPDDVALIVYTSGTTGRSKGAMITHANLTAIAAALTSAWHWRADDVLLLTLPLFHVHGLIAGLTSSLANGSRVLLRERFDADDVFERLERGGVTLFFGVPTMYARLIERARDRRPPPLRLWVCGSAALAEKTHARFAQIFGASILERYGATEFGFALSNRYDGPRVPGSVGVPLPGVSVRIAGPDGSPLPVGDVGELLVEGPTVFRGYWQQREATEDAFVRDAGGARWYRSGDLARYDAGDGVYRIVGRIKEVIITGGFNVYPREVEEAIEAYPGVVACAVVGKADDLRGELPVAFVEASKAFDAAALLATLRERLASFKVPRDVLTVERLPRNALGKIDKPALRALLRP